MSNVFVYGTLKSGFHNNHYLSGARFLTKAVSKDNYQLVDGGIPYAVPAEYAQDDVYPIIGELWEVDDRTLSHLDALEGHPQWYRREEREFSTYVGELSAWIYEYPHEESRHTECAALTELNGRFCYEWKD
jgi:gamma-glutamylaminecyclotransferase